MSSKFSSLVAGKSPFFKIVIFAMLSLVLVACADTSTDSDSSGSSGAGAPTTIIGFKLTETVTGNDGKQTTIAPPNSVVYSFIDANTIQGAGLNTLPTENWTWSKSGNQGTAYLNYGSSIGFSYEYLTFETETSGTYVSESTTVNGTTGRHTGTFTIATNGSSGGSSSGSGSGSGGACATNNTGEITIYTTKRTGGTTSVQIDGGSAGSLTKFYESGDQPVCGSSVSGATVTRTLSAGSHSVTAQDDTENWSGTPTIEQCGCALIPLN